MSVSLLFMIVALVLFCIAAANVPVPRVNLIALGLAFWIAATLFGGARILAGWSPAPTHERQFARDD
jgi:hypothetical protein